jgi:hypothetical protein
MITQTQLQSLKPDTAVSYGPYGKVFFNRVLTHREDGTPYDNVHVEMKDAKGQIKLVFESLFRKYGTIL